MDQAILTIRLQGEGGTGPTQQHRTISASAAVPQAIPVATVVPAATVAGLNRQHTVTNDFISIIGGLRGALGGIFGTLAGAALDVIVKFRDLARVSEQTAASQIAASQTVQAQADAASQILTVQSAQAAQIVSGFGKASQGAGFFGGFGGPQGESAGIFGGLGRAPSARIGGAGASRIGGIGQIPKTIAAPQIAGDISGSAFAGLAEAAPIVGAGVAAGLAINKAFHELAMSVGGPIEALGKFATAVAQATPDPAIAVRGVADYLKSLAMIPTFMTPFLAAISSATGSLADFMQAVDGLVNRYGPLSGPVTAEQTQAEVQQLLGDFRRAQILTPHLVEYIQARTELQQKFEEVKVKLLVKMLPTLTTILELISRMVEGSDDLFEKIGNIADMMEILSNPGMAALRRLLQVEEQQQEQQNANVADILGQQPNFFNVFGRQPPAGGGQP